MKLLFVTSKKPVARLIRWGLGTDCSHFAICFDEEANGSGIIFHSIFGGATLEWFGTFRKHSQVIHALEFKSAMTLQDEESIYQGMLAQYSGEGYDRWAFAYWCYCIIMHKIFSRPLPSRNSWAKDGYNLCTALAAGVKWIRVWAEEKGIDLEMIPPHELYRELLGSGYFVLSREWLALEANYG